MQMTAGILGRESEGICWGGGEEDPGRCMGMEQAKEVCLDRALEIYPPSPRRVLMGEQSIRDRDT